MYITVLNILTRQSVPFIIENGEIKITSTNSINTDETCIVRVGKLFYEHSLDLDYYFGRMH